MATIALPEAVSSTTQGQAFLDGRVWCEGKASIAGRLSTLGLPGHSLPPNGLNHGKAGVPEYRHVYMEERNLNVHVQTGALPEGTVIVKGLTRFLDPAFSHGSRSEPSRRGHFKGAFNGLDVTAEDGKRFQVPTYGAFSVSDIIQSRTLSGDGSSCERAGCHTALVAKTDRTWVQFYAILRAR